jgi:hypothetical protein
LSPWVQGGVPTNKNLFFVPQNEIENPIHHRQRNNHRQNERSGVKRVLVNERFHFNYFGAPFLFSQRGDWLSGMNSNQL